MPFSGVLMMSEKDNVATSLEDMEAGGEATVRLGKEVRSIKTLEIIPFGLKVAVADIGKGSHVIKYGESIGVASSSIKKGELVHIHNLEGGRGRGDLAKGGSK